MAIAWLTNMKSTSEALVSASQSAQGNRTVGFTDVNSCFDRSKGRLMFFHEGCDHYTLHDDEEAEQMPLRWYECQPVMSKKVVVMHLQSQT